MSLDQIFLPPRARILDVKDFVRQKINLSHKNMASKKRGPSYSPQEQQCLLDIVRNHLPIGQDDWEGVCADHLVSWPESGRDYLSVRRKFNQLANKNMPTGNPSCPPEVREAKDILELIKEKADIDNFSEEEDEPLGSGTQQSSVSLPATVTTDVNGEENDSSVSISSTPKRTNVVSPKLQRVSHSRKRKNEDEFSMQDLFKLQKMERQQDRQEAREHEKGEARRRT